MIWHILTTRPPAFGDHYEFAVQQDLVRMGHEAVVPYEHARVVRSRQLVSVAVPLMPRLVLAGFDGAWKPDAIRRISGVSGYYRNSDGAILTVPPRVVQDVIDMTKHAAHQKAMAVARRALKPGDHARVKEGPLAGAAVRIEKFRGGRAILSLIGSAVEVSITTDNLEAA